MVKKVEQVTEVKAAPFADTIEREVQAVVLAQLPGMVQQAIHNGVQQALNKALQPPAAKVLVQEEHHGVKRPKSGGRCDQVWSALDSMWEQGRMPTLADVQGLAEERGWNANNARIEFYQWRKFNGVTGRQHTARRMVTRSENDRRTPGKRKPRNIIERRVRKQDRRTTA